MAETVIGSRSGQYIECEKDRCLHHRKHLKYRKCEIETCKGCICVPCSADLMEDKPKKRRIRKPKFRGGWE